MAGYIWHIVHAYELYNALSNETRNQMPNDALKSLMLGAVIPDLTTRENKKKTHFKIPHPIYGNSYRIPDMKKAEELFLKKDPVCLGVLSHLRYDTDHIENFILVYAKPLGDNMYLNTKTGERMSEVMFFGDGKEDYGQLYNLYNRFNAEMAERFTSKLATAFGIEVSSNKEGFLKIIKWLFNEHIPLSGIEEMDKYRSTDELYNIIKFFFDKDGKDCFLNAKTDDLISIVKTSAFSLAKQVDDLYSINLK